MLFFCQKETKSLSFSGHVVLVFWSQYAGHTFNPPSPGSFSISTSFHFHVLSSVSWDCCIHPQKTNKPLYSLSFHKSHNRQCSHSVSGVVNSNMTTFGHIICPIVLYQEQRDRVAGALICKPVCLQCSAVRALRQVLWIHWHLLGLIRI